MKMKLKPSSRIWVLLFSLALLAVLFLPIWRIELDAPQYPEGLVLQIFADRLGGDVEVINGLNHYIGMQTLHTADFIEFTLLPYLVGAFSLLGILVALINRKWALYTYLLLFILFGVVSMVDFYRWNYDYGHNLDPSAPIRVPGMSYQPPLIGYKQLLNFGAFSIPDTGGWIFIGVGMVIFGTTIIEFRRKDTATGTGRMVSPAPMLATLMSTLAMAGCTREPQPLIEGKDSCHFCKMTITDTRYGGELITDKGKVFKFDDIKCLAAFAEGNSAIANNDCDVYFQDFIARELRPLAGTILVHHSSFHSPMSSNIAAFGDSTDVAGLAIGEPATLLNWDELIND